MAFRTAQPNFSKGELAPELYARTDVQAYQSAVKRARNVRIRKYGGLAKRMGTRLVAVTYARTLSEIVRLIPFQFNDQQTYVLEMGQGTMRLASGGGLIIETALAVTGISKAANAVVTAAYHGYGVNDTVYFDGIQGMVEMNGRTAFVTAVPDINHFAVDIDSTGYGTFTGSTGGQTNTGPVTSTPTPTPVPPPVTEPDPPKTTEPPRGGGGHGAIP